LSANEPDGSGHILVPILRHKNPAHRPHFKRLTFLNVIGWVPYSNLVPNRLFRPTLWV